MICLVLVVSCFLTFAVIRLRVISLEKCGTVLFLSTRNGGYEIYTTSFSGKHQLRITHDNNFLSAGSLAKQLQEQFGTFMNLDVEKSSVWNHTPAWSPDGTKIAYSTSRGYDLNTAYDFDIYVYNTITQEHTRLTNDPHFDIAPNWSPNGDRIAFVSYREGSEEIFVMKADGTGQKRVTNGLELENVLAWNWTVDWSPDSKSLIYTSGISEGKEIYILYLDSLIQDQLTDNQIFDNNPHWSPDGTKIVFTSYRDGHEEIYMMDADGTHQIPITNNPDEDWAPSWSPDGAKIAFISNRDKNNEMYLMNADGTEQRRLTNTEGDEWGPQWSLDGSYIVFSVSFDAPPDDQEIYSIDVTSSEITRLTQNNVIDGFDGWQVTRQQADELICH